MRLSKQISRFFFLSVENRKNPDLWMRFLKVYRKHQVKFVWVKGHATNPLNNRCDELATTAADGKNLLVDSVYEETTKKGELLD